MEVRQGGPPGHLGLQPAWRGLPAALPTSPRPSPCLSPLHAAASVDDALNELRGSHQKYKYIEQEIVQRKQRLTFKQPEIAKCLASVKMLAARAEEGKDVRRVWEGEGKGRGRGEPERPPGGIGRAWPCAEPGLPSHAINRPARQCRRPSGPCTTQTVLDFALSEQAYARARLSGVEAVNLWLGAGVMLEYSLGDAQALLVRGAAGVPVGSGPASRGMP